MGMPFLCMNKAREKKLQIKRKIDKSIYNKNAYRGKKDHKKSQN
jgi:hypothetical protein